MKSLFHPATWPPVVLAWSFLLLLPFGRSSELPVFIMAILGGILIWRHGKQIVWEGGARTFSLLFLCIWIPMALSVPDSIWFTKSLSTALTYPRIYFAGIYLIWMLREDLARQRLLKLSAWLLLFWILDALIQAAVGYDLLGYAYPERLNGLYGPHDWKLGLTLAMLSPIVWEYVSRQGAKWQLALAWLGTAAVVLLASNRESWIVFAIATLMWSWVYAQRLGFHPVRLLIPIALIVAVAGFGTYQLNLKFAQRMNQSIEAMDFSYEGLNAASSQRLHLWRNALTVLEHYPVNGAGVRSYRYAYPQFAEAGDPFLSPDGTGQIYAHQLFLEVGSETGLIGVVGLLVFFVIYMREGYRLNKKNLLGRVAWIGAFGWLFPFNTHTALYSAYWSLLLWWLIAITATQVARDSRKV
ncbi:MAG: O-antigen ligase family protein [Betaproteobacteria bacterium]|nr:O-antigen ligase family protein [Betaproteobacteria bacterium]